MKVVYGIEVSGIDDPAILRMEKGMEVLGQSKVPGAFWVDSFPWLRYIPSWMPGAAARRFAAAHRAGIASMRDDPFDIAKQEMVCAREKWSVVYVDSACIDGFCIDQRKQ